MTLEVDGVTRRFPGARGRGAATVLDGASGVLTPGVTLLLGANGAGKTTLLRLLAGVLLPHAGEIRWQGRPLHAHVTAYRRRLGYLPQRQPGYPELPVAGFLDYIAALKAIPPHLAARRRDELLSALDLGTAAREPVSRLPQGHRQLVALAQALLNDPDVLLLDEPLEGLDHESRHLALALIHRPGRVTVAATHRVELAIPGAATVWRLAAGQISIAPLNAGAPDLVRA